MNTSASATVPRKDFFSLIPRRSIVIFHLAVFCIFAPVGLLFVSSLEPDRTWLSVASNLVVSGLIAVSWAASFVVSRWFVVGIVSFNVVMVALNTTLQDSPLGIGDASPSLEGLGFVLAIVVGYVLFLVFISGQGRTTVRLMTEMALARTIHETLVPPVRITSERIEALGVSSPSTEMGGDLIDVVDRGDDTYLFLADVAGHGVRAGVVMGMLKSAIRMGLRRSGQLSALLQDLNHVLEATSGAELYATLAGLRIDGSGSMEYVLAGHHHIVHHRAASAEPGRLGEPTYPLGLFDGREYHTRTVTVESGDLFVLYSDGLNETADGTDEELGHEAIERAVACRAGRPLAEIRQSVFDLAEQHGRQVDDRTLLLVRIR